MMNRDFVIQFGRLVAYDGSETYIRVPDNVTVIGRRAFYFKKVHMMVLPASVTEIEAEAFAYTDLQQLKIEGIIEKVGSNAFAGAGIAKNALYGQAPIMAFSKKERFTECCHMLANVENIAFEEDVWQKNMSFLGKNMLMPNPSREDFLCDHIVESEFVFNELLEENYITNKDIEAVVSHLYAMKKDKEAKELEEYGPKCVGRNTKRKKSSSFETLNNPLKQQFAWKYQNGDVVITGCKVTQGDIEVPDRIGKRMVKYIGSRAFLGRQIMSSEAYDCETPQEIKRKLVLPDNMNKIGKRAFYVLNNMEVYLPKGLTRIDEGTFVAVSHLVIHIPDSVKEFSGDILWDSLDETVTICASRGSCAHNYAMQHNILFAEEI